MSDQIDSAEPKDKGKITPPPILVLAASIRSRMPSADMDRSLARLTNYQEVYELIYALASERQISNTDGIVLAASVGARSQGGQVRVVRLRDHYPVEPGASPRNLESLQELAGNCQGLVVGTPVYFGDRSSWVESFFHSALPSGRLPLAGKVVGFVSVGAKRNGGQETTNVLGLQDCLARGANILGNGPPTSQYGGTAVAGDAGAILDDNFGLQTSFGTGLRVAQMASLPPAVSPAEESPPKLLLLYTSRPDRRISTWLEKSLPPGCLVEEVVLDEQPLGRCLACTPCPNRNTDEKRFPCRQRDSMVELREKMLSAEGILLVGVLHRDQDLEGYQVFAERTRFIRRNNFELSHKPTGIVQFCAPDRDQFFFLRATNLFLRHNTLVVGPGFMGRILGSQLLPGPEVLEDYLSHFKSQIHRYRPAHERWRKEAVYEPVGYKS